MKVKCPIGHCRADNEATAEVCVACGTPLRNFVRLSSYPARLFNQGLTAARAGEFGQARELFAAVVHWCPRDLEARNALALACLELSDAGAARRHWEQVRSVDPANPLADRGLTRLDRAGQ